MKKILLLENKGEISFYLANDLINQGFKPYKARDVLDAQSIIEEEGVMDCYIIDLNVRNEGLNDEQTIRTKNGQITGWIWFKDSVLKIDKSARSKCIIYSDYISILNKSVKSEELINISLINKRGIGRHGVSLDEKIREILS